MDFSLPPLISGSEKHHWSAWPVRSREKKETTPHFFMAELLNLNPYHNR